MTEQEENERFTTGIVRGERRIRMQYVAGTLAYRACVVERALRVYFRFRALHDQWVEENCEPTVACVFVALDQARRGDPKD